MYPVLPPVYISAIKAEGICELLLVSSSFLGCLNAGERYRMALVGGAYSTREAQEIREEMADAAKRAFERLAKAQVCCWCIVMQGSYAPIEVVGVGAALSWPLPFPVTNFRS